MLGLLQKEREYKLLEYVKDAPTHHCLTHTDIVAKNLDMPETHVVSGFIDLQTYGLLKDNCRLTPRGHEFLICVQNVGRIAAEHALKIWFERESNEAKEA